MTDAAAATASPPSTGDGGTAPAAGGTAGAPAPLASSVPPGQEAEGGGDLIGTGRTEKGEGTPFDPATFEYPEGMTVDDAQKEFLGKFATDYKVPAEGVKALLDQYVQLSKAATDKLGGELDTQWSETVEGWRTETKTHYKTEAALTAAIQKCNAVIDEFGSEDVYSHLKTAGLANNLAMVQMFEKIGKAVGEGRPIPPGSAAQDPVTDLAGLYPTMVAKKE